MKQLAFATLALFLLPVFFGGCEDDTPTEFTHTCVFCKEEVKVGAIKCKHCGEHPYAGQSPFQEGMEKAANETLEKHRDKGWPWWKWPIMICAFFVAFGAVVLGGLIGGNSGDFFGGVIICGIIYWLW